MKGKKLILFIAEVAIFSALALALDFVCGLYLSFAWLNGGSISIAMVPIFIICYRWGPKGGFLTALLTGTIQIFWGYIYHPVQVMLDYPLAYVSCGMASLFFNQVKNNKGFMRHLYICLGILIGCVFRLAFATLSGCLFFETPFWASVSYNGTYLLPSMVLCMIITCLVVQSLNKLLYEKK
ncbi:MAG: energy-coupled thiamine transporter ThiT [Erysipelotrichaceae bacterium]|nr:energy-coupled thiamine transporter ThiT [Erysipelotrichaceae bacterium]